MRKNITISIALVTLLAVIAGCNERKTSFLLASDLHFDGTPERSLVFDTIALMLNDAHQRVTDNAGSPVPKPFGLFLTGDITESGKEEQWTQFLGHFGLNGEGAVKYPVYETFGNHDGNAGGVVREGMKERNPDRRWVHSVSDNGLHYAVRRGGNLYVVLGSYPGDEWDPNCEWCHYFKETFREPEGSLTFLREVLAENSRGRKMPVYLFFHYGWDGFSKLWWTAEEQARFKDALSGSDVRAIFHGHDHAAEAYEWEGIPVYSGGSPQRGMRTGNFLFVTTGKDFMRVFIIDNKVVRELK